MMRNQKILGLALVAALAIAAFAAPPASADFGLKDLSVSFTGQEGTPAMQAGSHPEALTMSFGVNTEPSSVGFDLPQGSLKKIAIAAAPGLVGNPTAVPYCSSAQFLSIKNNVGKCPDSSVLGLTKTTVLEPGPAGEFLSPVYNLPPPPGVAATIGFWTLVVPTTVDLRVNPLPPYNVIAEVNNIPQVVPFYESETTLWGNPASPAHDGERGICAVSTDLCPVSIPEKPFLTMPSSCSGPLPIGFSANSWEGGSFAQTVPSAEAMVGCEKLGFAPQVAGRPTSSAAEAATGLDFTLSFNDEGLANAKGTAQSTIKKAVVKMPEGVTLNPGAANGLAACSEADLARESFDSAPGAGCPEASKVGEVEVETPLLENKTLEGSVYVASQDQNTVNSRFAFYMVIKEPLLGISVKQAAKIVPDPRTGQITTSFEDVPQFPFSELRFHFSSGPRAPLVTPPRCGTYETTSEFTPWSGAPPRTVATPFQITSGCPASATPPFDPGFEAGTTNNAASHYSPFYMRLTRRDGDQDLTRFDSVLPQGVIGKIKSVPKCSDAQIAAAKAKSGRQELASSSCPTSSQLGHVLAGAGVGSGLTYAEGKIYLAGPFAGAPLSIVVLTPAVAGPFDLGTVVTREALNLNPITADAEVSGASAEPIPHILEGIPLRLRDLRAYIDRSSFVSNATGCEPKATVATLFGSFADPFNPGDDVAVKRSSRYQASSCASLAFKPRLSLALKGGTRRSDHPSLRSTITYPYPSGPGYANIGKAVVTLPPTEFIDNAHIQNPCTRVQFNAEACPKGSILGTAKATSPLLDDPLQGKVYFRSNGGERLLPDIVMDLRGQFRVILTGFVKSKKGRIVTTFENVPDAPVTRFDLNLYGGKRGLLVNSANLCKATRRAEVALTAQSGKGYDTKPVIDTGCKKGSKGKKKG